MEYEAFVYCWTDHKNKKLYIGSHKGTIDDGYICSSKLMLEEYKKRQSVLLKGMKKRKSSIKKTLNISHRKAISLSKMGKKCKPFSATHKENMSISRKKYLRNNKNPRCGKHLSDITKSKISSSRSEKWIVTEPNGKTVIITNLLKYCKDNQLIFSCMYRVSIGERNHHKNYKVIKHSQEAENTNRCLDSVDIQ